MKYTPKEVKDNVNVSSVSPIRDFFELVLKILGILLLVYIVLGLAVDYVAPRLSLDMESKISKLFSAGFERRTRSETEEQIQIILDELVKNASSLPKFDYKVHVSYSRTINALAYPGGHIVILSALLKEVESKNELAMVLAHELGHYVHRDHLRGLGRGLIFLVLSSVTFGADSAVSKFITNSLNNVEMRFSQTRERASDLYALELLNKTYGNVAGALDFYEKMSKKEKVPSFFYLFASHPYPESRINILKETIITRGYKIGERIPIDKFKGEFTKDKSSKGVTKPRKDKN